MITIIFESHGTTFDNENKISSGWADAKLSPLGKKQSKELGERYKNKQPDVIFCSDLSRSYESGEIAFKERGIPIIKDRRLRECDYGDLTQHPSEEIKALKKKCIKAPFPNGESYQQTSKRMKNFLKDLLLNHDNKTVMIIGHRATQYGLERWIKGLILERIVTSPWQWQPGWTYRLKKMYKIETHPLKRST